jgi:nucleotide-binding universal stress UspA family protein
MKILLAIDSSPASQAAVREVSARPWPAGTTVEVLSAVEPPHTWSPSEVMEELTRQTQQLVQRAAEQVRAAGLTATAQVLSGDAKSVIVDRAAAAGAGLVVLGSHGTGGLTQFLLGSVARAVVRFAPCSTEIVRSSAAERAGRGMKLLLASDGSDSSALAARSIGARPWPPDTEVRIFSVVELALTDFQAAFDLPFDSTTNEKIREDAMRHAQEAIRNAEAILTAANLQTSESISVLIEPPEKIILDEAATYGADMIVTGSHGRRGINRFMLGSVSETVATHAECSVEVIRGPQA